MPLSREGHTYTRHKFKAVRHALTGGCHADVFLPLPSSKKAPVAITYHGGGFVIGDSQHIFCGHVGYLLERGFGVVGLEYRMAPHVRFPEIREDLVDGYKWVLEALPALAPVDPRRVFVFGGSAGGYSTLSLSIDAHRLGLPLDRANYVAYPLADLTSTLRSTHPTYDEAVAALSDTNKAKVDTLLAEPVCTGHDLQLENMDNPSPRAVWGGMAMETCVLLQHLTNHAYPYPTEHSPLHHLHPSFPPTVLVLAEDDTLLSPEQTRSVYTKLKDLGVDALLLEAKGMPHGALDPAPGSVVEGRAWWDSVAIKALEFCVERCK